MESVGARLKRLRLEKGLSLEEVHKKTKVHINILKAIEEDSLINFNPIYMKGFLKIYCKFLGVSPRDYIPDYQEPDNSLAKLLVPEHRRGPLLKTVSVGLVSLGKGRNLKIIFVLLAVFLLFFGLNKFRHSRNKASPKQKTSSPQISYPAKTKTSAVTTTKGQTSQVPATAPKEIPSVIRLGAYAREDCWILLKADGRVVFQNILKKGRSENWQADQKIEFSLGNAGVVDLEVNGKRMPVLGRRGQVIKNIVITKEEGLRVP